MEVNGMLVNQNRIQNRLEQLAVIGKIGETGVCRLAHSKEDREAVDLFRTWMDEAGFETEIDCFGNLVGKLQGTDPSAPLLVIGSHLDSQPYGGRFDGAAGCVAALEVAQTLKENDQRLVHGFHLICFSDEEGSRFAKGLFGSKGLLGMLKKDDLERQDKNGMTRREALQEFGVNPLDISYEGVYKAQDLLAFLELHIEQGPILDKSNEPIGIVTGISGPLWLTVTLEGKAGHTGSVPMSLRQDALVGAAEIVGAIRETVTRDPEAKTIGSVGSLRVFPDSRNIIPEKVTFTVDLRDIDLERRNECEEIIMAKIKDVCQKHHLTYDVSEDTRSDPKYCADWIKDAMREEAKKMNVTAPEIMSGPFHDAITFSEVCDYGMIFIRCKDGISHHPDEFSTYADIALGTELLYHTALKIGSGAYKKAAETTIK
ncbi:hydantoinase [Priestia koreensis]|uniref:Hydantoinase n=2 Tax=Priestia koreensis TaxID=284581 RepID=A0A0M0L669_9BACI|nr:hydantoinase [Priestia koreensis]